jgi:hypothetical protein
VCRPWPPHCRRLKEKRVAVKEYFFSEHN